MDTINLSLIALEETNICTEFTSGNIEQTITNQQEVQQMASEQGLRNTSSSTTSNKVRARLPKLQLSTFDGNFTEWQSFWDNFESVIDQNEDLSDTDKFSYLKVVLSGQAACTIEGFP